MATVEIGHRHPEARRLRELLRDPTARRAEHAFVLEGPRLVVDALNRGGPLECVYVGPNGRRAFAELVERVELAGIPVRELKDGVLEKLGSTRTPQPVLAVAPLPAATSLATVANGLLVLTVDVQDPGNLGTILRSAEAAGAVAVVVGRGTQGVDPWNPKVVRGSAGAVLGPPVVIVDDPVAAVRELRERGFRAVGADGDATDAYCDVDLTGPIALVIGSEAHGLPPGLRSELDQVVAIPMAGATESLNAGVAASILMFEAARQTRA